MNSKLIAKLAGVSRSTVSKVINNYSDVSKDTKEKVLKIIEEYEYYPNLSAQKLAGKKSQIIGLLVYTGKSNKNQELPKKISDSFYYSELISQIIDMAENLGYIVLVSYISSKLSNWKKIFENGLIDGAIVIAGGKKIKEIDYFNELKYKAVLVDYEKEIFSSYITTIKSDHFKGGYLATNYLLEKGHTKILHLSGEIRRKTSIERARGYLECLKSNNIEYKKIIFGKYNEETAFKLIENEINKSKKLEYSSIFAGNDYIAYGVIKALEKYNIRVPEDISIIGYDDMKLCEYTKPRITSVNHLGNNIAEKAIYNLIKIFNEEKGGIEKTEIKIIERESVREIKIKGGKI